MRRFLTGFALALVAWMALGVAHHLQWRIVTDAADAAGDFLIRMTVIPGPQDPLPPMTLVDFDAESYAAYGAPPTLPREALARILAGLAPMKPRAIVLDVDIAQPGMTVEGTEALTHAIRSWGAGPPLLLLRDAAGEALPPTPVDEAVAASPALHWTHANFITEQDGVARRMALWLCAGEVALPAPQGVVLKAQDAPPAPDCAKAPDERAAHRDAPRVAFYLPWDAKGVQRLHGLDTVSAHRFEAALRRGQSVDDALFRDRIVLIGASHRAARNTVATPIGTMPGVVVLANAIGGTLRHGGPLRSPGRMAGIGVLFGLCLVAHLLYLLAPYLRRCNLPRWIGWTVNPFIFDRITHLVVLGLWYGAAFALMQRGYVFDIFASSLLAIVYFSYTDLEDYIRRMTRGDAP